jgi:hypothetical protein
MFVQQNRWRLALLGNHLQGCYFLTYLTSELRYVYYLPVELLSTSQATLLHRCSGNLGKSECTES